MTTRSLFGIVLLALILSAMASAQTQLINISGAPCTYSWRGTSGNTGCNASGTCSPQQINGPASLAAGWDEIWACAQGYVVANGSVVVTLNALGQYPYGLFASGRSDVTVYYPNGFTSHAVNRGYHNVDCSGFDDYSGPYSYYC